MITLTTIHKHIRPIIISLIKGTQSKTLITKKLFLSLFMM